MQIKLINDEIYELPLNTPELEEHFRNANNFTKEILHQFNDLNYYKEFLTPEDKVILDFGSNVGLFAIHVSPWAEKVLAFEPTPAHYKLNKLLTKKFKNIKTTEAAVAGETGEVTFYTSSENSTMNSLINRKENSFQVKSISIVDILSKFKSVDFIKMDIEGSEIYALTPEAIKEIASKAKRILIEFHCTENAREYENRDKFKALFEAAGMKTKSFSNDGLFCFN
jgi:FkbM family methyltransferase